MTGREITAWATGSAIVAGSAGAALHFFPPERGDVYGLVGSLLGAFLAVVTALLLERRNRRLRSADNRKFIAEAIGRLRALLEEWDQLPVSGPQTEGKGAATMADQHLRLMDMLEDDTIFISAARQIVDPDIVADLRVAYRLHAVLERIEGSIGEARRTVSVDPAMFFVYARLIKTARSRMKAILTEEGR